MEKFNQQKYIQQYNKEHYKTFKVNLKQKEWDELEAILKQKGLSKAQFLRLAIKDLKHSHNSHH